MFDFTPVGGAVAIVGVIFVALVGWRLIPAERLRRKQPGEIFEIEDYVAEAQVPKGSGLVGKTLRETEEVAEENGVDIVGLIRKKNRISLDRRRRIEIGDILILEAAPDALGKAAQSLGLEMYAGGEPVEDLTSDDVCIMEAVVG